MFSYMHFKRLTLYSILPDLVVCDNSAISTCRRTCEMLARCVAFSVFYVLVLCCYRKVRGFIWSCDRKCRLMALKIFDKRAAFVPLLWGLLCHSLAYQKSSDLEWNVDRGAWPSALCGSLVKHGRVTVKPSKTKLNLFKDSSRTAL